MPAPNIPFQQLPAGMSGMIRDEATGETRYIPREPGRQQQQQGPSPERYFQDRLKQQQDYVAQQYNTQWELLRKTSRNEKEFRGKVDQLMAGTDAQMNQIQFKHQQQMGVLNQVNKLVEQRLISPEAGQRATWQQAGFNIPKPGSEQDWRLEHGRIIAELKRIDKIFEVSDFPKTFFTKEYAWDKMSPEKQEYLHSILNAKEVLLQQEKDIFQQLPGLEKKAVGLQAAYLQKEKVKIPGFAYGFGSFGVVPKRKPQTFAEGIRADMPQKPALKKLTKEIAKQYVYKYGSRQAAMEAARKDGYTE